MKRKIVEIDRDRCDGCGLCVLSCAEGAIRIIEGKAALSADNFCDGLGACLGECPRDAIRIIEREADVFDETAVGAARIRQVVGGESVGRHMVRSGGHHGGGRPGMKVQSRPTTPRKAAEDEQGMRPGRLGQWPVQLKLVPANAPFFENADLLIAADCVPFAYGDFHKDFLAGKALVVGCPKLDDNEYYTEKLTEIFRTSSIRSVTVVRMEVPCCGGIEAAAKRAMVASGKNIPCTVVTIGVQGDIR
jgi:Pyruvate/2-oxoacid:ferredoxin oxidoreductase delta subunit